MSRLFISYNYTASDGDQTYQGFENMVGHPLVFAPSCIEHLEGLHNETAKHCREKLRMKTATTTIIFWKELNGS